MDLSVLRREQHGQVFGRDGLCSLRVATLDEPEQQAFFLVCGLARFLALLLGSHFIPDLHELGGLSIGINATGSLISRVGLLRGERNLFVRIFL